MTAGNSVARWAALSADAECSEENKNELASRSSGRTVVLSFSFDRLPPKRPPEDGEDVVAAGTVVVAIKWRTFS